MKKGFSSYKKSLLIASVWIFFITSLLHFTYSFTGFYPLSFISAVNESVWEHAKIVFFATLFYNIFIYIRSYRKNCNFIAGLGPSLASILITVPFLFYGYSGILGFNLLAVDLIIVLISALIAQYILIKITSSKKDLCTYKNLSLLLILAMVMMLFLFTWYPPNLPPFQKPLEIAYSTINSFMRPAASLSNSASTIEALSSYSTELIRPFS